MMRCILTNRLMITNINLLAFDHFRLEREKGSLANELTNSKTESDKLKMEKAVLERDAKNAHYKLNEAQLRLDEASRNLSDLESLRNKLVGENGELERKMDEAYSQVSQLNKIKVFTLIILCLVC